MTLLNKGPSPQPKLTPYLTIIPDRRPVQKTHTNIGHAKNALNGRIGIYGRGASEDMELYEHVDGEWKLLYSIKKGEKEAPWRKEELEKARKKREADALKAQQDTYKYAAGLAKHYYENVVGTPEGEEYETFVEGYIDAYMRGMSHAGH